MLELVIMIFQILTFMVNLGSLCLSYCQHKKQAATAPNSDGSATD